MGSFFFFILYLLSAADKNRELVRLWWTVEWKNKQMSTSFPLSCFISSLSLSLSSTSTLCPLFPASVPPLQAHVGSVFMVWVSVFITDEESQAAKVLLGPQLPLATGRDNFRVMSRVASCYSDTDCVCVYSLGGLLCMIHTMTSLDGITIINLLTKHTCA